MMRARVGDLEVLSCAPKSKAHSTPLLFIHGAYAGAWCWAENFLPYFAEAGYASHAVSLRGHGGSIGRDVLDTLSIDDYVRDARAVAATLPQLPVLIGHSMGGMVVQKFLEQSPVPAAVLMASVPPHGLMTSAFGLAFNNPGMMRDLNRLLGGGPVALDTLRDAMFAQPVSGERLRAYCRLMQPESHRAIWDMTLFNLPLVHRMHRPPMLVLGAEHDQLIPAPQVALTASTYGVNAKIFSGFGHGMMLERDWNKIAKHMHLWLTRLGI
jgi:non-heme chloroperoxidase